MTQERVIQADEPSELDIEHQIGATGATTQTDTPPRPAPNQAVEAAISALQSCKAGGYRDVDGDWCDRFSYNQASVASALTLLQAELARPLEVAAPVGECKPKIAFTLADLNELINSESCDTTTASYAAAIVSKYAVLPWAEHLWNAAMSNDEPTLIAFAKAVIDRVDAASRAPVALGAVPLELQGIEETVSESGGWWSACTGCHEANDGHGTGPYSAAFKCALGGGCSECGGIGAVWNHYTEEDMVRMVASVEVPASADAMTKTFIRAVNGPATPPAQGDAKDAERMWESMRARTLLAHLWRKYDMGGISMGRSHESVVLEAVLALLGDPDHDDMAKLDSDSGVFINETRNYLSGKMAKRLGLHNAAILATSSKGVES